MLPRLLSQRLPRGAPPRRIVLLTGARQVGKTTLARSLYEATLRYLNLDSPGERQRLGAVPAEGWDRLVGPAMLDEVQKAPGVLDKLKWAYDERRLDFSVLLGSSRVLLLEQVRETLAGRAFHYELGPLVSAELAPHYGGRHVEKPLIARLWSDLSRVHAQLGDLAPGPVGPEAGAAQAAMTHLLTWGGLPTLLEYPPAERMDWLRAYQSSYLERDLADLARLRDLDAFTTCHRLAALRAGRVLSYSELARDAGLPVTTTRRYLRYLELSFQTSELRAWSGNPSVRLVKAPKLVWFDAGVQRALSGQYEGLAGEQYESAVVAQILTTLSALGAHAEASYLRTSGGLEVDLVLERQDGLLAVEIKSRPRVDARDARAIEGAVRLFGDRYRGGLVVYRGAEVKRLTPTVWAVPDWLLLAG